MLTSKPILGLDALLKGQSVIGGVSDGVAWAAPQNVTPPWLEELLANQTKS